MTRYYYTVTTVFEGEPTYHRFYCSPECTQRKVQSHFKKKGHVIDSISGIWKE